MCGAEAVSNQTIDFADVENYSFENIFEMVNAEYIGKWALTRTAIMVKHLLERNPSKL